MKYPTLLRESCGFSLYKAVYSFHYESARPHKVYPSIDLRVALNWTEYGWLWHWMWLRVRSVPIAAVMTAPDNFVRTIWVITHNSDSWFRRHAIERLEKMCINQGILLIRAPAHRRYHEEWVGRMLELAKIGQDEKFRSLIVYGEGVQCHQCRAPLKYYNNFDKPIGYFKCAARCGAWKFQWNVWLYDVAAAWADNVPSEERSKQLVRLQKDLARLSERIGELKDSG